MRLSLLAVIFLVIFINSVAQKAALEDDNPADLVDDYDDQFTTLNTEADEENVTREITFADDSNLNDNESLEVSDATVFRHLPRKKSESETKKPMTLDPDECGDPPSVKNAIIYEGKEVRYEIGAKVTYACEFGYITDGSVHDSECLFSDSTQTLHWTDPEIRCSPRSCGDPGYVAHAHRVGSVFTFPNKVSFECDDGYALRGYGTRYCQTSGAWSGKVPTCEPVFCDPPANPENGKVSYLSLGYESELRYECDSGFILKNDQGRICSANGTWSGVEPTCQDAQCDQPVAPEYGTVEIIGDKSSVGSMALYTCNEGRTMVGSATSRCLDIGEWTFPTPKCLEPCFVPKVEHGRIGRYGKYRRKKFEELNENSRIEDREELYLRCEPNYEPFGKSSNEEKVTCSHGEWEEIPVCEPAVCRGPAPPTPNAYVKRADRFHGGGIVYTCRQHSKKVKFGNVTCFFGTWKGVTPVCKDLRCPIDDLAFPGLVKENKKFYLPGQKFRVTCQQGFDLTKKNNEFKCMDGEWKGHMPPCIAASCNVEALVQLEGVIPDGQQMVLNGNFLEVKCPEGYTPSGKTARCAKGQWHVKGKLCQESGCTIHRINNGGFTEKVEKEDCGWFTCTKWYENQRMRLGGEKNSGSSVEVSCDAKYTFQGKRGNVILVTCTKGKWYPDPVCLLPGTPYIGKEESALQKAENSNARISTTKQPPILPPILTTQSRPSEPGVIFDPNVNLDPTPYPPCTCTYQNADDNVVALVGSEQLSDKSKVKNNEIIKFHCRHFGYYRFIGAAEIKCEHCRTWHSSEFPQCENPKTGDTILQFEGLYTVLPGGIVGVVEGGKLSVRCFSSGIQGIRPIWYSANPGEQLTFSSYTDYNGYFISVLNISNAAWNHNKRYLCNMQGYRPSAFDFQVIKPPSVNCTKFDDPDFDIHYDNEQAVNSTAMFLCKDRRKKIEGPSLVTCLSNGQWSGGPPTCRIVCPPIVETEDVGVSNTNGFYEGSNVAFHCLEPRKRIGAAYTTCQANGEWTNPPAKCVLSSCSLQDLFNVVPENVEPIMEGINSDSLPYNTSIRLTCNGNRMLAGSDVAKCGLDGKWQVSKVQCLTGCSLPETENSGLIIEPIKAFYRFGESVSLSCSAGYILNSEVVRLMCLGSTWSENILPKCVEQ